MIILGILAFIFGIGIIIILHELGHFYCAKKSGIMCHEFSIGFGPILWSKQKGETKISIRLLPIGGYVAMADSSLEEIFIKPGNEIGINLENGLVTELITNKNMESEISGIVTEIDLLGTNGDELGLSLETENGVHYFPVSKEAYIVASEKDRMQITPYERTFDSKKVRHRAITMGAGVIMNFLLAIFLYIIISFSQGVPNLESSRIGEVSSSSPAESIGLKADDRLDYVLVNGKKNSFSTWTEFSDLMNSISDKGITNFIIGYTDSKSGNQVEKEIQSSFVAQNIGLSNAAIVSEYEDLSGEKHEIHKYEGGVQVGNLALKYGTSSSNKMNPTKDAPQLTNGDYIIGMYITAEHYIPSEQNKYYEVNSWEDIVQAFNSVNATKDKDIFSVRFKFYDQQTSQIVEMSDPVYTYSDALLDSQQIVKYKSYIGVTATTRFDFFACLGNAFKNFWSSATIVFRTLKELIAPTASVREVGLSDLSGVVGIFDIVLNTVKSGSILPYLSLIALLSVNIGIMNLLPIPGLDGGRLVFLAYEGITHKKPNKSFEAILTNIMFFLLLALFIFVTYNDILRLFR